MPSGGGWKPKHSPWLIALAVMIVTFMEVMDTSIASVAVPYIAGSTASTNDEAEWVLTVYLVANAVFLPASTWFSERFGRKRFLMFSIVVFTVASFACGIAPTLPLILLARCIQGAGGGALQPLAQSILIESFPPEKQGQALGLYALGVVLAPVIGPAFGGYLTDAISWRWAFYINVPIGLLALLLQSRFLEDPPYIKNAKPGKLDGIGLGLLSRWVACMQFVLDKGQEDDWFGNTAIRWACVVMVITLIAFLIRELTHAKPLVDLRFCQPEPRHRLHACLCAWSRHLFAHNDSAGLLSNADGLRRDRSWSSRQSAWIGLNRGVHHCWGARFEARPKKDSNMQRIS